MPWLDWIGSHAGRALIDLSLGLVIGTIMNWHVLARLRRRDRDILRVLADYAAYRRRLDSISQRAEDLGLCQLVRDHSGRIVGVQTPVGMGGAARAQDRDSPSLN